MIHFFRARISLSLLLLVVSATCLGPETLQKPDIEDVVMIDENPSLATTKIEPKASHGALIEGIFIIKNRRNALVDYTKKIEAVLEKNQVLIQELDRHIQDPFKLIFVNTFYPEYMQILQGFKDHIASVIEHLQSSSDVPLSELEAAVAGVNAINEIIRIESQILKNHFKQARLQKHMVQLKSESAMHQKNSNAGQLNGKKMHEKSHMKCAHELEAANTELITLQDQITARKKELQAALHQLYVHQQETDIDWFITRLDQIVAQVEHNIQVLR